MSGVQGDGKSFNVVNAECQMVVRNNNNDSISASYISLVHVQTMCNFDLY